jgi:hypothetical protein
LILITLIFVKNYKLKESQNNIFEIYISEDIEAVYNSTYKLEEDLQDVFESQLLIEHLTLKRQDDLFLELSNTFNLSVVFSPPIFNYVGINKKTSNLKPDNIQSSHNFDPLSTLAIEFNELWNNKEFFTKYEKPGVEFSGVYKDMNGEYNGFIYFFDSLMKLSPKEKLGEDLILEIFDDGILILTNQNEFQVLF